MQCAPTIEPGDQGFDGLDLRLVGGRIVGVEAVRLSGEPVADFSAVAEEAGRSFGFPTAGCRAQRRVARSGCARGKFSALVQFLKAG